MNRTDIIAGSSLLVAGVLMALEARTFPSVGGMAYGPSLFPTVIAVGLMASGAGIAAEGAARASTPVAAGERGPRLPVLLILATLAGFALLLPVAGFHIAGALAFFASMRIFRATLLSSLLGALIVPVVVHWIFYSLLRVPLPWGLLLPIAW